MKKLSISTDLKIEETQSALRALVQPRPAAMSGGGGLDPYNQRGSGQRPGRSRATSGCHGLGVLDRPRNSVLDQLLGPKKYLFLRGCLSSSSSSRTFPSRTRRFSPRTPLSLAAPRPPLCAGMYPSICFSVSDRPPFGPKVGRVTDRILEIRNHPRWVRRRGTFRFASDMAIIAAGRRALVAPNSASSATSRF